MYHIHVSIKKGNQTNIASRLEKLMKLHNIVKWRDTDFDITLGKDHL